LSPKTTIFGIDFRCVCGILFGRVLDGFRLVLGDLLVPKRWSKGKEPICGNACFIYVLLMFSRVVGSMGVPKRQKNRAGFRFGCEVGFVVTLGLFLEQFSKPKSFKNQCGIRCEF
jgi:hypothetical protein